MSKFSGWLRSDMHVMRWVFLASYLAPLAWLVVRLLGPEAEDRWYLLGPIVAIFASLVLFVMGAGTSDLGRPIGHRRLWMPISVAALILTILTVGALMALSELMAWDRVEKLLESNVPSTIFLAATLVIWGALARAYVKDAPRMRAMERLTGALFGGGLAVLLASMPAYVIVDRRGDFGLLNVISGMSADCFVILFSLGAAIALLFLRPRFRREQSEAGIRGGDAATQVASRAPGRPGGTTMRRLAFWACLYLMAGFSQPTPARAVAVGSFGMRVGLSASRQHGETGFPGYRAGIGAGLSVSIPLGQRISLQPEVLYIMKGGKLPAIELTNSAGSVIAATSTTYAVDYLEIPVLVRVGVPTRRAVEPFFVGGPSVAFKVSEEYRFSGAIQRTDPTDDLVTTDVGLAIGAGLEVGRGRGRLLVEARYTAGVINAFAAPATENLRNGAFLITAGLAWRR